MRPAAKICLLPLVVLFVLAFPKLDAGSSPPTGHETLWCMDCHTFHGATNLALVKGTINTPNSGQRQVVFQAREGPGSFADGDGVYDGICEVCHTATVHHRNDPSGDHAHFPGANCTACHRHADQFQPSFPGGDHPQAQTDCANCHADKETQKADLLGMHHYECQKCHPTNFAATILGPIGTWDGECSTCHNPTRPETGNRDVPTKGHRCVVCHGEQRSTADSETIHKKHAKSANCVVCHGFIPKTGTVVGSGSREVCKVCHAGGKNASIITIHEKHAIQGLSCLECHDGERPAVDVTDGAPVGSATNVCQICHTDKEPSDFDGNSENLHKKHARKSLDCGACHLQANLQDDAQPMPAIDDPVRALVDRSGYNECALCHSGIDSGSSLDVHKRHLKEQWQWCYNCHEGTDGRPQGLEPPVTEPAQACALCHDTKSYQDQFPFGIHEEHARKLKCYACHQATPPLFDWPAAWMISGAAPGAGTGPLLVTGVAASDGTKTDKVRVTWNAAAGATGYEVWRSTSNSSGSAQRIAPSVSGTKYDDTSASVGTTYWYWVKAENAHGTSGFSASASGHRALPRELIVDNRDPGFRVVAGTWGTYPQYGYRHDDSDGGDFRYGGSGSGGCQWSVDIPVEGMWEVSAWWVGYSGCGTNVPYVVHDVGGPTTVRMNQTANGKDWKQNVGTFHLRQGPAVVEITRRANGLVFADAVRFRYVGPVPQEPSTIISALAAASPVGEPFLYTIKAKGTTPVNFNATGLPGWLRFDGGTTLSGTPGEQDIGECPPITLTATNALGSDEQTLQITVVVPDIIVDNVAPGFTVVSGTWKTYPTVGYSDANPSGGSFRHKGPASGASRCRWTASLPVKGIWEVSAWWAPYSGCGSNVPFTVHHVGGTTTVRKSQKIDGRNWTQRLGEFHLAAGPAVVEISDAANGTVFADAVRFRYVGPPTP